MLFAWIMFYTINCVCDSLKWEINTPRFNINGLNKWVWLQLTQYTRGTSGRATFRGEKYTSHMLPVVERSSSVAILDDVENIVYSIPNRRQSYTLRILVRARRNTGVGLYTHCWIDGNKSHSFCYCVNECTIPRRASMSCHVSAFSSNEA